MTKRPVYVCPHCKTRVPFGTETQPPPSRCPGCNFRLGVPSTLESFRMLLPANLVCPECQHRFVVARFTSKRVKSPNRCACLKCSSVVEVPDDPFDPQPE